MNRPWSRTPAPSPAPRHLRADDAGEGSVLRRPLDPQLPPRPSTQVARDAVNKAVTELHAAGALDAGNGDVLDGWLDALHPQWSAHATMSATEHAGVAQLVTGDYEAAAVAARQRAEAARAELEHTERLAAAYEQALLPGDAPDQPDRRHRRPDLERLEGLTASRWSGLGGLALLLLVGAGDLVTFWMTLAGLLRENGVVTWILVGSFTFASMAIMHFAGHTAKNAREGQGGLGKSAVLALVSVWAVLGAVTFYVRTQYTAVDAGSAQTAFGADPAAAGTGTDPMLSALLLLGLFLASGFLAFWVGFSTHHPRMATYRKLRAQATRQRAAVATTEQTALAAERLLADARMEEQRVADRTASAARSVAAEIAELKELARLHLAGLLGEPAATNAVTTGRGTGPSTRSTGSDDRTQPGDASSYPDASGTVADEPAAVQPAAVGPAAADPAAVHDDAVPLVRARTSLDALLSGRKRINGHSHPTPSR
jgi:hypothetical protein